MIHNGTFNITPGKKTVDIKLVNTKKSQEYVQDYEISYNEEPVLINHGLVQFTYKEKTYIGFVTNPWFEGAYKIPSFSCSHILCLDNKKVELREQTFRFKNVEIIDNPDISVYNQNLQIHCNLRYFSAIKAIDKYVPKLLNYYFIEFSSGENKFTVIKAEDTGSEQDNNRRLIQNNYFETFEAAENAAEYLNIKTGL